MEIRNTRHAVYNINYHIVWIPKYRKKILIGKIELRLKEMLYEVAENYGYEILGMEVMPDHIHLFVSAPPRYAPADVVKKFKGVTGSKLFLEFPILRRQLRKGKIWTRSYFVGTAGTVTSRAIRKYIDEQKSRQASKDD